MLDLVIPKNPDSLLMLGQRWVMPGQLPGYARAWLRLCLGLSVPLASPLAPLSAPLAATSLAGQTAFFLFTLGRGKTRPNVKREKSGLACETRPQLTDKVFPFYSLVYPPMSNLDSIPAIDLGFNPQPNFLLSC